MKQTIISRHSIILPIFTTLLVSGLVAFGQLQWNSYNNAGALVTANVASGGDSTYGNNVTFNVPPSSNLVFMTEGFVPVGLPAGSAAQVVNFNMNVSGGLYPGESGRLFGMGLFNNPNTTPSSALGDQGYWVDFNSGNPSFELFYRTNTVTTFFNTTAPTNWVQER
jgi:hypothetical protein